MRSMITPAPELICPRLQVAQDCHARIGEEMRPRWRAGKVGPRLSSRQHGEKAAAEVRQRRGPPRAAANQTLGGGEKASRPALAIRRIEEDHLGVVRIALARRPAPDIQQGSPAIRHAGDSAVEIGAEGPAGEEAFRRADHEHFEDKAMIVAGLLTAEPIGKDLALGLDFEPGSGGAAPPAAWGKPGEGAGADIKAEELRQKMVVGRGAMAAQRGEILLMAEDLVASEARVLEAFGGSRPATEKAAGPGEADQAERDLDATRPVDPRQERVRLPP